MRKLILVNLSGVKYGIWSDDIQSVRSDLVKNCRPYGSGNPCITGTVLLGDRFLSIADLSICLGYPPNRGKQLVLVLLPVLGEIAGFITSGGTEILDIESEQIFPLPDYIQTKIVDTCVVNEQGLIPVINIKSLQLALRDFEYKPILHRPKTRLIKAGSSDTTSIKSVLCGGRSIILQSTGDLDEIPAPERVITLPNQRVTAIDGLGFDGEDIVPLFQLSRKIRLPGKQAETYLRLRNWERQVVFKVDSVGDELDQPASDLPPLLKTRWMTSAVIDYHSVIPIIDVDKLFLSRFSFKLDTGLVESSHILPTQTRQLVEITLQGDRFAIPEQDIQGVTQIRRINRLPKLSPIILGAVVYQNSIVPVLDLAAVYGQKSSVSSNWKLVLVQTARFPVFIIAEKVFRPKRLPRGIYRDRTIRLPFQFNYGSYLDSKNGDLVSILNIYNIALYSKLDPTSEFQKAQLEPPVAVASQTTADKGPVARMTSEPDSESSESPLIAAKLSTIPSEPASEEFQSIEVDDISQPSEAPEQEYLENFNIDEEDAAREILEEDRSPEMISESDDGEVEQAAEPEREDIPDTTDGQIDEQIEKTDGTLQLDAISEEEETPEVTEIEDKEDQTEPIVTGESETLTETLVESSSPDAMSKETSNRSICVVRFIEGNQSSEHHVACFGSESGFMTLDESSEEPSTGQVKASSLVIAGLTERNQSADATPAETVSDQPIGQIPEVDEDQTSDVDDTSDESPEPGNNQVDHLEIREELPPEELSLIHI